MNILSINYGVHDAAACVLVDGEIKSYYKEERLTGIKRDTEPKLAIKQCLDDFGDKIDYATIISYPTSSQSGSCCYTPLVTSHRQQRNCPQPPSPCTGISAYQVAQAHLYLLPC